MLNKLIGEKIMENKICQYNKDDVCMHVHCPSVGQKCPVINCHGLCKYEVLISKDAPPSDLDIFCKALREVGINADPSVMCEAFCNYHNKLEAVHQAHKPVSSSASDEFIVGK